MQAQQKKPTQAPANKISELVINWHITEACNYGCKFCYAKWDTPRNRRDLVKNIADSRNLLLQIRNFFHPSNHDNPLQAEMCWESVRINFAGGEPLLYAKIMPELLRFSREIGLKTSIITNGSHLSEPLLGALAPNLDWLGLSVDSAIESANQEIGRVDRRGNLLDIGKLAVNLNIERKKNPNLKLKVNTVINALNANEDMGELIRGLSPEKWKILRVLPTVNRNLEVSDRSFGDFVKRHSEFQNIYRVEDNHEMLESYIMIDPNGRFYQNGNQSIQDGYQYSDPILDTGLAHAFSGMRFLPNRFAARYNEAA
ncbi:MAG: viperin family antiviral radical SAM protein [Rhodobacteraceae bacterium]|nr:viperin family antiviral radical SAM protein [Paracoccaceae bacterium]